MKALIKEALQTVFCLGTFMLQLQYNATQIYSGENIKFNKHT